MGQEQSTGDLGGRAETLPIKGLYIVHTLLTDLKKKDNKNEVRKRENLTNQHKSQALFLFLDFNCTKYQETWRMCKDFQNKTERAFLILVFR